MTREEAKRTLEYLSTCSKIHATMFINSRDRQAIDMAIKVLEDPERITITKEKILQCISELEENSKYHADFIQRNTKFIIEGLRMALDFMEEGEEE